MIMYPCDPVPPKLYLPRLRQMTICKKGFIRRNNNYVFFPEIDLRGKWLLETGFEIGQVIDITYEHRRIVITLSEEQRFDIPADGSLSKHYGR